MKHGYPSGKAVG